jgi:hypothetical protein
MEDYLMTEKERVGAEFDLDTFDSTYKMMVKGPVRLLQVKPLKRLEQLY